MPERHRTTRYDARRAMLAETLEAREARRGDNASLLQAARHGTARHGHGSEHRPPQQRQPD